MIRVCMFAYGILEQGGGLEKYYTDIANGFHANKEITLDIVTLDDKHTYSLVKLISLFYLKKYDSSRVKKISTETVTKNLNGINYIKAKSFKEARKVLQSYDVIYSKNELVEAFILKYFIIFKRIPSVIFGCHTPIHYPIAHSIQSKIHNVLYGSIVYKILASNVHSFHVLNSDDEMYLKKLFNNKRVYKIQNPFDFKKFNHDKINHRINLNLNNKKINFVWVGRLVLQKGIKDLSEIIESININLRDKVLWTIVGSGSEEYVINRLLKKYENINFLGHVDHEYIPSILSQHNALISTSHWEGYPYNILEAQAANIDVFAYNIAGCNDLIKEKEDGILSDNLEEYKIALEKYIMNEAISPKTPNVRIKNLYSDLLKMYVDSA